MSAPTNIYFQNRMLHFSEVMSAPTTIDFQQQMLRYAEDLQELLSQQSALHQRNQIMINALGRGGQDDDLMLDALTRCIDIHLVTDLRGAIVATSSAAHRELGFEGTSSLMGKVIFDLLSQQNRPLIAKMLQQWSTDREDAAIAHCTLPFFGPLKRDEARIYDALLMPVRKRDRTEIYWLLIPSPTLEGVASNVWNLRIPAMAEVFEGLMITNEAAEIQYVNDGFTQITGYAESEVLGKNPRLINSGLQEPTFYRAMWNKLRLSGSWSGEMFNRRKNGQIFFEWLTIKAIKNIHTQTLSYMAVFADKSPSANDHKQLAQMAFHDALTGLPNRRLLDRTLKQAIEHAKTHSAELGLLIVDLNHFKRLNGKVAGEAVDEILQTISGKLQLAVRGGDMVARIGDDEFAILLPTLASSEIIENIANQILQLLDTPLHVGGHAFEIQASVGCARFPQDGEAAADLFHCADAATYAARQFNLRFCFFENDARTECIETSYDQIGPS